MKDRLHGAFLRAEARFLESVSSNAFLDDFHKGVTVALSGGADSVLLLLLMTRLASKEGFFLSAVYVHHGIRGSEADADAAFCAALCMREQIRYTCIRVNAPDYPKEHKIGIEEAARILRYQAIDEALKYFSAEIAVTAHHAGDNLETILFHLARGSGITGLSGIPPRRNHYVRPLLLLEKREITDALMEIGESYKTDSSNSDRRFSYLWYGF